MLVKRDNGVGLYLDVPQAETLPPGWNRRCKFCLRAVNQRDRARSKAYVAENIFQREERDWGFQHFLSPAELSPGIGFIEDDKLVVEAEAFVLSSYDGSDIRKCYDSKTETGYVGIKNQGATCYMNSLLQTLFHTAAFRKAVYLIPTYTVTQPTSTDSQEDTSEEERAKELLNSAKLPLALQRLFCRLQCSDKAVGTKELTKSFGWTDRESFLQHDVQELSRVLIDRIEEKMKGTGVEGSIANMFRGKLKTYIKCVNIDYESSREEDFYDLSLNVKGCDNIYASLDQYIEVERLEKENQYHAEGFGLQDAEKGVIFVSMPPILHIQLKRFEFDPKKMANIKVNDRFSFPPRLEIAKRFFVNEDPNDTSTKYCYQLHAVLVHSGSVHGGHYYAFIRPTPEEKWFKFDDDKVVHVNSKHAIEENYGGTTGTPYRIDGKLFTNQYKRVHSAYMLVYIREDQQHTMLGALSEDDIPQHIKLRFEEEQREKEERRKEKLEASRYLPAKVEP